MHTQEMLKPIAAKFKTDKNTKNLIKNSSLSVVLLSLAACKGGLAGDASSSPSAGTLGLTNFSETGTDSYVADDGTDSVFIAEGMSADYTVLGGAGDDTITTSDGADMIRGGEGVDTINAGAGDDAIVVIGTTTANQYTASSITNSAGTGTDLSSLIELADLNGRTVSEVQSGEVIDGGAGNNTLFIYGTVDLTGVTLTNVDVLVVNSNVTLTEEQLSQFTTIDGDGQSVLNITVPDGAESVTLDLTQFNIHDIGTLNIDGDITIIIDDISDIAEIGTITVEDLSQITLSIQSDTSGVTNINLGELAATFEKIDIIETDVDVTIEVDDDGDIDDLELEGFEGYGDIEDNRDGEGEHDLTEYDHTEEYNHAPVLHTDIEDTHAGSQEIWIDVLANDEDHEGSELTISGIELVGEKGSARIVDNIVLFDPGDDFDYLEPGAVAEVKIWYTATDGDKSSTSYAIVVVGGNYDEHEEHAVNDYEVDLITGSTIMVTTDHIDEYLPYDSGEGISFYVSNLEHGTFKIDGVETYEFSFAHIDEGLVTFSHDGSEVDPTFDLTLLLSEGSTTVNGETYSIEVNTADFIFDGENTLVTEDGADRILDKSDHDGNYTVIGADGNDTITMGAGNDLIDGAGGADTIHAGGGHDRIVYGQGDTVNGGTGFDTLVIEEDNLQLDLASLNASKIEMIDMGVETDLVFTVQDVLDIASENQDLVIWGDASGGVTSTGQGWDFQGQDEWEGQMMDVYMAGDAMLLVDTDITQDIS